MEEQKPGLLPEFEGSAAPPPERVSVTLDLDPVLTGFHPHMKQHFDKQFLGHAARYDNPH
jgi:hypothetical protein